MTIPVAALAEILDDFLYDGQTLYGALIDNNLQLNIAITGDAVNNKFTASAPHKLVAGSRIRFAVVSGGGNFLPGGLNGAIDYFAIILNTTEFKIAATLTDAIAATAIDFSSNGQGVLFNEQILTVNDPIGVIVNHELPAANGYNLRLSVTVGAAAQAATEARKNALPAFVSSVGGAITYRHIALIKNGSDTIGSTYGDLTDFATEATAITVADGDLKTLVFQMFAEQQ